jgi:hypothetical protein
VSARFSDLVIDAKDAYALADWWAAVFEVDVHEKTVEDDGMRLAVVKPPDSVRNLVFIDVPEGKTIKNRLHLDLRPLGCDQATELERLLALGARQIDIGQGDQTWVVLADPEGNELCLLRGRFDDPDVD